MNGFNEKKIINKKRSTNTKQHGETQKILSVREGKETKLLMNYWWEILALRQKEVEMLHRMKIKALSVEWDIRSEQHRAIVKQEKYYWKEMASIRSSFIVCLMCMFTVSIWWLLGRKSHDLTHVLIILKINLFVNY